MQQLEKRFRVEEFLANKSGAWWYLVRARQSEEALLLRIFSPALIRQAQQRKLVLPEELLKLGHRCLTRIRSYGEYRDQIKRRKLYYAIEDLYRPEQLLQHHLDAGGEPLPLDQALTIAADLSAALTYLEAHQQAHGSLDAASVLLDEKTGGARLVHPVVARLSAIPREREEDPAGGHRRADAYLAPELGQAEATIAADIYAFGALLFLLLTGRLPYSDEATQAQELLGCPDPRSLRPELRSYLTCIVVHALQRDADKRYRRAGDLASDCYHLLQGAKPEHALAAVGERVAAGTRGTSRIGKATGKQRDQRPGTASLARRGSAERSSEPETSGSRRRGTGAHSPAPSPAAASEPTRSRRPWLLLAAGVLVLGAAGAIGLGLSSSPEEPVVVPPAPGDPAGQEEATAAAAAEAARAAKRTQLGPVPASDGNWQSLWTIGPQPELAGPQHRPLAELPNHNMALADEQGAAPTLDNSGLAAGVAYSVRWRLPKSLHLVAPAEDGYYRIRLWYLHVPGTSYQHEVSVNDQILTVADSPNPVFGRYGRQIEAWQIAELISDPVAVIDSEIRLVLRSLQGPLLVYRLGLERAAPPTASGAANAP